MFEDVSGRDGAVLITPPLLAGTTDASVYAFGNVMKSALEHIFNTHDSDYSVDFSGQVNGEDCFTMNIPLTIKFFKDHDENFQPIFDGAGEERAFIDFYFSPETIEVRADTNNVGNVGRACDILKLASILMTPMVQKDFIILDARRQLESTMTIPHRDYSYFDFVKAGILPADHTFLKNTWSQIQPNMVNFPDSDAAILEISEQTPDRFRLEDDIKELTASTQRVRDYSYYNPQDYR